MRRKTWHWEWSCRINYYLCNGRRDEPLCSRVFRQPNSWWRTAYIKSIDRAAIIFLRDIHHCLYIHLDWIDERVAAMGVRA